MGNIWKNLSRSEFSWSRLKDGLLIVLKHLKKSLQEERNKPLLMSAHSTITGWSCKRDEHTGSWNLFSEYYRTVRQNLRGMLHAGLFCLQSRR